MVPADDCNWVIEKIQGVRTGGSASSPRPHKLILLLALVRLYRSDPSRRNDITLDDTLCNAFKAITKEFFPFAKAGSILIEYPFFHLTSDGIWRLTLFPDKEAQFAKYRNSPNMRLTYRRLLETVQFGHLDEVFDRCFRDPTCNARLEQFLGQMIARVASLQDMRILESQRTYSLFAHEKAAIDAIDRRVKARQLGELLPNLEVYDPQSNRYFEVDLVVIAPSGVFVTELKHWSGRIEIRPNSWLQNGSFYKKDPHRANSFKAKLLRGLYERQFPSYPSAFFESVVVLTNPEVRAEGHSIPTTTKNNPTFESIDRFLRYLKYRRDTAAQKLTANQRTGFAQYLRSLHTPGRPRDFIFPGYEIVERLYQYADRAEVVARRTGLRHRKLCRLRIFYPATSESETTRREVRERATNTLNAVAAIGDHPNILKVWDIPNEYGYVVEGSDWSETGTLRDLLEREGQLDVDRAVAITSGLLRGLHAAHEQCVVHRSVSPENVLMVDDQPKLMNFDLAYQLADDRVTVIPDSSQLPRTAYIAPEIYAGDSGSHETADLFSVGVILYEMLTGRAPLKCSTDLDRTGGRLTPEDRRRLLECDAPEHIVQLILDLVQRERHRRPRDAMEVMQRLEPVAEPAPPTPAINRPLETGECCGVYEIRSFLRFGAESQLYDAQGLDGRRVALKLFNCDVPRSRVVNEHRYSGMVRHPSIVHVDSYNQWTDKRYYIAFDWIEGRTLREAIAAEERPGRAQFCRVAQQMLDALQALHENQEDGQSRPILHNDIKPDNILLAKDDRPVLIDFGAASEPHVGTYQGTEGYVAPDLRLGEERQYCEQGDLYALAVTLHEWLTGTRPPASDAPPPGFPELLLEWLEHAHHSDASERFRSAEEMKRELVAAIEVDRSIEPAPAERVEHEAVVERTEAKPPEPARLPRDLPASAEANPFVAYLNSMHSRGAETDNALAECQAVNPFFAFIHVPHPLVDTIQATLLGSERQHVVVTGHAGDGKSTIAVELYKRLAGSPLDQPLIAPLRPREDLIVDETPICLIKDFSEWSADARARLLDEMLAPAGPRFFLISNTGTLLDAFKRHEKAAGGDWTRIENDLLHCMEQPDASALIFQTIPFTVINITMMDNLPIAEQIFRRMIAPERWQECARVPCREHCPIYRNVQLIRENEEVAIPRLFLAYRRLYEYEARLTLRQLCAHLAYMITSGLTHQDVIKMSERASPPPIVEFMFFNRFFGDDGRQVDGLAQQLRAIRAIRQQDFGSQLCPTWERKLWLQTRDQSFQLEANLIPDDFEYLRRVGAGQPDDLLAASDARRQVRRAVFFLHRCDNELGQRYLTTFLKSAMLLDFVRWQIQDGESLTLQERNSLRLRILHVLQEHFSGVRLPEGTGTEGHLYITLSRRSHDIRQSAQVVLARYPEDDFRIVLRSHTNAAGGRRRELVLIAETRDGQPELSLRLPFLDYVMLRNQGELGQNLQASYVDRLERFKGQLIQHAASRHGEEMMLVRLRTNHTFRRQIFAIRDDRLEVSDG